MSEEKTHKFQTWCKRCKFRGTNPDKCIACLVRLCDDVTVPAPPGLVLKVIE